MKDYELDKFGGREWDNLHESEKELFYSYTDYLEKLKFWRRHNLKSSVYYQKIRTNDLSKLKDEILCQTAKIYPETTHERETYYEFEKSTYKQKYPHFCDLDYLKQNLEEQLNTVPDPEEFLKDKFAREEEDVKRGRGMFEKYFRSGYKSTFEGKNFDFSNLEETAFYRYILEGETKCKYIAHIKRRMKVGTSFNEFNLNWQGRGSIRELSELIYALCQTKKITYKNTGEPVTQKDLKRLFETIFNTKISDVNDNLRSAVKTYKTAGEKGYEELFTFELLKKVKEYKDK